MLASFNGENNFQVLLLLSVFVKGLNLARGQCAIEHPDFETEPVMALLHARFAPVP
jgi:hypothetical protein